MSSPTSNPTTPHAFVVFMESGEPKLRRALVTRYGADVGREATADALAYAWEHWDRVERMNNPIGYLYRVGQSATRRWTRPRAALPAPENHGMPWIEPGLPNALEQLSTKQRQAVVLVHGFGYTHAEVADLLGISRSSVQNHVERGLSKLQARLEVHHG